MPDAIVDSVTDITVDMLRAWGIAGIALDLDNTIVPWHTSDVVPGVEDWVRLVRESGVRFILLTNNYGPTAREVANKLDMALVRGALKPVPWAFTRCLRRLSTRPAATLMIGDQIFTDVLGAKSVGMRAAVVRPVARREFATTKFLRMLEAPVYARLGRSDMIRT